MKKNYYEHPLLNLADIAIEQGFQGSLLNYDETPDMPYGDDSEQWF